MMNPRASIPMTLRMPCPSNFPAMLSTTREKPSGSARRGVMSLKTTPALGKSGMSRIRSLSRGTSGSTTQGYRPQAHGASPLATLLPRTGSGGGAGTPGGHRAGRHLGRAPVLGRLALAVGRVEDPAARCAGARGPSGTDASRSGRPPGVGRSGHGGGPAGQLLADGGVAGLALLEDRQERRRHEDRRVGPGEQADEQRQREVLQGGGLEQVGADDQQRQDR